MICSHNKIVKVILFDTHHSYEKISDRKKDKFGKSTTTQKTVTSQLVNDTGYWHSPI